MSSPLLLVGLDAGGSTTHLRAQCPDATDTFERQGPGANPNRTGWDQTVGVLVSLVKAALQACPNADRLAVCAGVAGAGRPRDQDRLTGALRRALSSPERTVHVEVVHDALIALDAAYDAGSGLVVIAGTGSMVLGRTTDDKLLRAGGWGHVLGDDGSGYALGRAGLRAVAAALDGGPATALRARVRDRFGLHDREALIDAVYQSNLDVAAVAPLVVTTAAEGDAVAADLLAAQIEGLTDQVTWLLDRAEAIAPNITLVGGLLQNEHYARSLRQRMATRLPSATIERLDDAPVAGALRRARRLPSAAPR